MTCGPDCVVCDRAGHLPEKARECLHRNAGKWKLETFGGWAGFIVSIMGACWTDGYIVGRHEERERHQSRYDFDRIRQPHTPDPEPQL